MDPYTQKSIIQGATLLKKGSLVGFPTETVYGLGANALDEKAVAKIFHAKGRPGDNPLIVHISNQKMLAQVVKKISPEAKRIMKHFWPGPLTILFPKHPTVPLNVTAGLPTVAVRMPAHPLALSLIERAGVPIAAPSANRSGRPSPTTAAHVREDFKDLFVIDGGNSTHGVESTVITLAGEPRVLRLGAITIEDLRTVLPSIKLVHKRSKAVSPGMKHRHYSPKQPLVLFGPHQLNKMQLFVTKNKDTVVLCKDRFCSEFKCQVIKLGATDKDMAKNLFAALRTKKGKCIAVLGVRKKGIGKTIMDRLERAASKK